ncbi:MAG: hypothetical protein MJK13_07140, partial [Pseudomonadales bacterium]|nr:hypothetical protein [Pseudomonadales bacterium]
MTDLLSLSEQYSNKRLGLLMSDNLRQSKASNKPKWGATERQDWLDKQSIKRSYQEDVLSKIDIFSDNF